MLDVTSEKISRFDFHGWARDRALSGPLIQGDVGLITENFPRSRGTTNFEESWKA